MKLYLKCLMLFVVMMPCLSLNAQMVSINHKDTEVIDVKIEKSEIEMISNLVYAQPPIYGYKNKALEMDIIKPVSKELLPTVVFVPGGGFVSSSKSKFLQNRMALAEAGYVVASIEYRVAPEVTFPKPLMDVKSAIRFLRANHKRFGIDPEHIAVMGNSAGGYLAAITGTTNGLKEFEDGENLDQKMMLKRLLIYTAYLTLIKSDTDMKKSLKKSITQPAHLRLYG